ncbi:hypothetical protein Tco_1349018, partial [Tanacetum coccineum]
MNNGQPKAQISQQPLEYNHTIFKDKSEAQNELDADLQELAPDLYWDQYQPNISDADADADANRPFNDLLSHLSGVLKSEASIVQPSTARQKESNAHSMRVPTTSGHGEIHTKIHMSGDDTSEAIPTSVTEAEHSLSNLSSEHVATDNECKDGPFSNALIAKMEADMHGIQIIKNVELEKRKELGAGTYGTVYHEGGKVQMLPLR